MSSQGGQQTADRRRARSIEEFDAKMRRLLTPDGVDRGLALALQPGDVVISPFSKCGTTWIQQIVHSLRTRGDMDFDDISRVVPWIEASTDLGLDLDAPQRAEPRAFKSHLDWSSVPKGGRYIVAFRDPRDALVSLYRFMEGWFLEPGAVSIDEFGRQCFLESRRDYWTHLLSWWAVRDRPNVLALAFEHMKRDLPATVSAIARFLEIPLDGELRSLVNEHASLAFMKRNADRFDDRLMRERSERVADLPGGGDSSKVRQGGVGGYTEELSADVIEALDRVWQRRVESTLGFTDYAALLREVAV